MRSWRRRRFFSGLAAAAFIGVVLCIAFHFDLLHDLQLRSTDFLFKAPALEQNRQPKDTIMIVAIDDKSIEQLGHFPSWPRSHHAHLIDVLAKAKARLIVFDILFSEPTADDESLAISEKAAGNVILPITGTSVKQRLPERAKIIEYESFLEPLDILKENAAALGHANILPDDDGIVRRLPVVARSGDDYEMALAPLAAAKYRQQSQILKFSIRDNALSLDNQLVPIDDTDCMLINYLQGADANNPVDIEFIPYVDVLRDKIDPAIFQDKLVIIGATAVGIGDIFWTPTGRIMSGVEIHAQAMRTILSGNFLKQAPAIATMLTVLIFALLCGILTLRFRVFWAVFSVILLFTLYTLVAFSLFDKGVIINMVYPPLALLFTLVGMTLYRISSEQSERKKITKLFGLYVAPQVVNRILTALEEGELKLGGEQHDVTVMFADIRGFTSISDKIEPEKLVRALNIYLSAIVEETLKYDGMINKFGGDSVMAVWNVPTECKEHALLAIQAAVDAQRAIKDLQKKDVTLPKMDFGIGINTGKAVAGNMGSEDRLEYSVIGDAVNLAYRLTSITPGGEVWIGSSTFELAKARITAKQLAPLTVKGKDEPVIAYEVIGYVRSEGSNKSK